MTLAARSLPRQLGLLPAAGVALLGAVALIGEYGRRQITRSIRSEVRDNPANWGLEAAEELTLTARDGIRLHAWLFAAPSPAPTVIVCHGHGGNKHSVLPVANFLSPRYNVLLLDSRGHGESGGTYTTIGFEERLDVHAAVEELAHRNLGPIAVLGISMGAAVALLSAAEDRRIAAVVADSPYARLRWVVAEAARRRGYPALAASMAAFAGCGATAFQLRSPMAAFDPIEVVHRIAPRPILLMHGEEDDVIDLNHARLLFARAKEPKELWILDGLAHCRGLESACEAYQRRILDFLGRWLTVPSSVPSSVTGRRAPVGDGAMSPARS